MKKKWYKNKKIISAVLFLLVLLIITWWVTSQKSQPEDNFEKVNVTTKDLTIDVAASGTISAFRTIEVKSKASCNILKLLARDGDYVTKGQLLLVLNKTDELSKVNQCKATIYSAEANLEKSKENLKTSKRNFDQQQILLKSKYTTKEEALQAESTYNLAKAEVKNQTANYIIAKEKLKSEMINFADTEIKSPIDGVVLERLVEEGQIIASGISANNGGTTLFTIGDTTKLLAKAEIDEVDISKIHLGQNVNILVDAYQNRKFKGTITHIAPQAITESNVTVFAIEVTINDKDRNLLKPGMTTTCEILVASAKKALVLPNQAIYFRRNQAYVYVKNRGRIHLKSIKIGLESTDDTQVLDGLKDVQTVYLRKTSKMPTKKRSGNRNSMQPFMH
ncbi:MAG: efflux RND transporter periplasmic adaptor subunit [Candidatus Margulisiibacteriota bacterium]|jgi:HlyD family secretion protein